MNPSVNIMTLILSCLLWNYCFKELFEGCCHDM